MTGYTRRLQERFWSVVRPVRNAIRRRTRRPPVGRIDWGRLRTTRPVSRDWGFDRGTPVDRYYIEEFLSRNADTIRGRVLEVSNNAYTIRFGAERVTQSDVIHPTEGNPNATMVLDLSDTASAPAELFDCIICTQTLQFIYDCRAAMASLKRLLRPEGILLLTVPGISQISPEDMETSGDYWRFTNASVRNMIVQNFPGSDFELTLYGNVLAATALLQGISADELMNEELDARDPQFEVLIAARVTRSSA